MLSTAAYMLAIALTGEPFLSVFHPAMTPGEEFSLRNCSMSPRHMSDMRFIFTVQSEC